MSIRKEFVKYTGNDIKFQINLDINDGLLGLQQENNRYAQESAIKSINEERDVEVRTFKLTSENYKMYTYFWSSGSTNGRTIRPSYQARYTTAGFSGEEVTEQQPNFLNSFYILDFYDTFDSNTQLRIYTTYLCRLGRNTSSIISLDSSSEFYKSRIPKYFLDAHTGSTITGYTRFSFYDAKQGKIRLFYNKDNEGYTTAERMYFTSVLNLDDRTISIRTDSITTNNRINLYEIKPEDNEQYLNRYNDTYNNYENLKQNYPSGTTFNFLTGKYFVE